jgi:hypothetical protein
MKNPSRRFILIALVYACGLAFFATPTQAQDEARIAALERENAALKQRVAQLEAQLAALRDANVQLQQEKHELSVLAAITPAETLREEQAARITVNFDQAADRTQVLAPALPVTVARGNRADTFITPSYSYPGRQLTQAPEALTLFIQCMGSGGVYGDVASVGFTLDGQRSDAPVANYKSYVRRSTGVNKTFKRDNETLWVSMPLDLARKIAKAKSAQVQLAYTQFALSREQVAGIEALLARIDKDTAAAP